MEELPRSNRIPLQVCNILNAKPWPMSVALIIVSPVAPELAGFTVPVASQDVYRRIWLTGAAQTGAHWLPLFETGVDVEAADFPALAAELDRMRDWLADAAIDADTTDHVRDRIDLLLASLRMLTVQASGSVTVFIG